MVFATYLMGIWLVLGLTAIKNGRWIGWIPTILSFVMLGFCKYFECQEDAYLKDVIKRNKELYSLSHEILDEDSRILEKNSVIIRTMAQQATEVAALRRDITNKHDTCEFCKHTITGEKCGKCEYGSCYEWRGVEGDIDGK